MINKSYADITIKQTSDNNFDIKISGNFEDLLKGLAGAVTQTIAAAPESMQQMCRTRFLGYLNQSTIEEFRKEM